jgi:hypothetical protein
MTHSADNLVKIGSHVEVDLISSSGEAERLAFDLVHDNAADFSAGFLGVGTPLGQAIVGRPVGATLPYRMADVVAVRIIRVADSLRVPDAAASATRRAAAREAVERHDREEMARLALTVAVKWGEWDYVTE